MKYFTSELWDNFNSEKEEERIEADRQWYENCHLYNNLFNELKKQLPKKFINIYEKNERFHDWKIDSFNILFSNYGLKNAIEIDIVISYDKKSFKIIYKGIEKISIEYQKDSLSRGFDDWGYSEFLKINDETFSNEILFASGASILIYFKKISIKSLDIKII